MRDQQHKTEQQNATEQEGGLTFPCDVVVKAMGNNREGFAGEIFDICREHMPELQEGDMHVKHSSGGKYTSVNVKVNAKSREQLEKLYQALNDHPDVHMTL